MINVRVVAPRATAEATVAMLRQTDELVWNVIWLKDAAFRPDGDVVMFDLGRSDASVILADLRELGVHETGSISIETIDTHISEMAEAAQRVDPSQGDAVVWEEVEAETSENASLSTSYLVFMVCSAIIAACGLLLDSAILIVGAMVVGPEFGPIAGFCVAAVQRRGPLAVRSFNALAIGLPVAVVAAAMSTWLFELGGLAGAGFTEDDSELYALIANPDGFTVVIAAVAGVAGMISLTSAKSGALVGVLISVTTIPAASAMGVATAYGEWHTLGGASLQLLLNVVAILAAGVATLTVRQQVSARRRRMHLLDPAREAAGLPIGRSRRGTTILDPATMARLREEAERRRESKPSANAPTREGS